MGNCIQQCLPKGNNNDGNQNIYTHQNSGPDFTCLIDDVSAVLLLT